MSGHEIPDGSGGQEFLEYFHATQAELAETIKTARRQMVACGRPLLAGYGAEEKGGERIVNEEGVTPRFPAGAMHQADIDGFWLRVVLPQVAERWQVGKQLSVRWQAAHYKLMLPDPEARLHEPFVFPKPVFVPEALSFEVQKEDSAHDEADFVIIERNIVDVNLEYAGWRMRVPRDDIAAERLTLEINPGEELPHPYEWPLASDDCQDLLAVINTLPRLTHQSI